jgi:hypothetical protein
LFEAAKVVFSIENSENQKVRQLFVGVHFSYFVKKQGHLILPVIFIKT